MLTGRGGDMILIDDPLKPGDATSDLQRARALEWYDGTLSSRLDSKTDGVIIVTMQRLHVDDLLGHLLEKDEHWETLDLPAIADAPMVIPSVMASSIAARSATRCTPREPGDQIS